MSSSRRKLRSRSNSALANINIAEDNDLYICPISASGEIMRHPLIASDGRRYEAKAFCGWLLTKHREHSNEFSVFGQLITHVTYDRILKQQIDRAFAGYHSRCEDYEPDHYLQQINAILHNQYEDEDEDEASSEENILVLQQDDESLEEDIQNIAGQQALFAQFAQRRGHAAFFQAPPRARAGAAIPLNEMSFNQFIVLAGFTILSLEAFIGLTPSFRGFYLSAGFIISIIKACTECTKGNNENVAPRQGR